MPRWAEVGKQQQATTSARRFKNVVLPGVFW